MLLCDNACAVGLANDTVKMRRSKSIDMRYHWIKDRVKQTHFNVIWQKGADNLADFFTKPLPASQHQKLMHKLVASPPMLLSLDTTKHMRRALEWRQHTSPSVKNCVFILSMYMIQPLSFSRALTPFMIPITLQPEFSWVTFHVF
jgi:hypothetical protein